jgi:hypothetical protein
VADKERTLPTSRPSATLTLVLKEVGGAGQQRPAALQGNGGWRRRAPLPLVMYLAAAGVGTIGVADHDSPLPSKKDLLGSPHAPD